MNGLQSLLDLPLDTITVLASGYLGYILAYTGKNKNHKTANVVFLTLVFGLVAKLTFEFINGFDCLIWVAPISAVIAVLTVSAIWRRWGQKIVFNILKITRVSVHDGHDSAWDSIITNDQIKPSQIIVRRQDGVWVMCNDLGAYEETRTDGCYLGSDGSVALYITHQKESEGDWEDVSCDIVGPGGDYLITIIPSNQIAFVQLRSE